MMDELYAATPARAILYGGCQGRFPATRITASINTLDEIAAELFGVMTEATMRDRPADIAEPLLFDRLPHDVKDGWRAVARHVRHAYG
jgi:hypothetical protein